MVQTSRQVVVKRVQFSCFQPKKQSLLKKTDKGLNDLAYPQHIMMRGHFVNLHFKEDQIY